MILKGFRFGMILQLAVGPISLFILQVALSSGLGRSLQGVVGVTLVDGLFVLGAILGLGNLIDRTTKIKVYMKYFGGCVVIIFGVSYVMSVFGHQLLPSIGPGYSFNESVFVRAVAMTSGNPLTLVFWAGVFSTKMVEEKMTRKHMYLFGIGAILSTFLCMTLIAVLGGYLSPFLDESLILVLNVFVGLILIAYGLKSIFS